MTPRTGRPATGNARDKVIPIRLTAGELEQIQQAAEAKNTPVSTYIRDAALRSAKRSR